ncbi:MAG: hypothetical protein AVDCRST_MAG38-2311 [uncultured Solirubrobacteraceae bacterium]|uniref:Alkyl hydroperoxide reductase subunit C/ Thiol specific antioxidant domain-containing protein n=1 Tax=uncultured Solirubrobacteraceae bacterium TaxID=1162706 RepID=A0A6J4S3Y1_9ACTN|nr:MAG: hypothetical protein AVDCRST_MAG38-2311 [uncultured Solirubrobacteraceae bacterium]
MTTTRAPALEGRDLLGTPRRLPDDLPADPTVVVLGFSEPQQTAIDGWVAALPGIAVIEAVVVPRRLRYAARFIEGGMAAALRDPVVLRRTWCLYTDVDAAMRALGSPGQEEVAVAVIRRDGQIEALVRGTATPSRVAVITEALETAGTLRRAPDGPAPGRPTNGPGLAFASEC